MTHAVIVANPNSNEAGEIRSRHRSAEAAEKGKSRLAAGEYRWAYVAQRRADGSYPARCEALRG